MQGFTSGLNPDVVKTELDELFFQKFDKPAGPNMATALSSAVFNQSAAPNQAVNTELFMGTGFWQERDELQDVNQDHARVDQKQLFDVVEYSNSIDIPKRMFDDAMFGAVGKMITDFGETGRITRDREAFGIYRDAFTGATFTTNDGVSLINASHSNINGDTVDNTVTGDLTETTLNTGLVSLLEQVNQRGIIRGHQARTLLVSPAGYKNAIEITDSELRSGTSDNDLNVFSAKYNLTVMQSEWLSAAAGGDDDGWFLLSDNHSVNRWTREGMVTRLMDWALTRNNVYVYKGHFREVYGAMSYEGIVGSQGA